MEADLEEKTANTGNGGMHLMPQQLDLYSRITTKHNILPKGRNNVSSKHNPIL